MELYDILFEKIPTGIKKKDFLQEFLSLFPGKENDVIILNMTRSGSHGIGFATETNRLNVAASRSKGLNLILMNMDHFGTYASKEIQTFLQFLKKYAYVIDVSASFPNL